MQMKSKKKFIPLLVCRLNSFSFQQGSRQTYFMLRNKCISGQKSDVITGIDCSAKSLGLTASFFTRLPQASFTRSFNKRPHFRKSAILSVPRSAFPNLPSSALMSWPSPPNSPSVPPGPSFPARRTRRPGRSSRRTRTPRSRGGESRPPATASPSRWRPRPRLRLCRLSRSSR